MGHGPTVEQCLTGRGGWVTVQVAHKVGAETPRQGLGQKTEFVPRMCHGGPRRRHLRRAAVRRNSPPREAGLRSPMTFAVAASCHCRVEMVGGIGRRTASALGPP